MKHLLENLPLKEIGKAILFSPILIVAFIIIIFVGIGLYLSPYNEDDSIEEDYRYWN